MLTRRTDDRTFLPGLTSPAADFPVVVTEEEGFAARIRGHFWWKRIEISRRVDCSSFRNAVVAHETFHGKHFHNELSFLIFVALGCNLIVCFAVRDWGRMVLEAGAFVACMTAWSWLIEFVADAQAAKAGYGPDLAYLYSRQVDSGYSWTHHPTGPARVAYMNWLYRRHGY